MIYHVKCLIQVKKNQSCKITIVHISGPLGHHLCKGSFTGVKLSEA